MPYVTVLRTRKPTTHKPKTNRGTFLEWFGAGEYGGITAARTAAEEFQTDHATTLKNLGMTQRWGIACEFEKRGPKHRQEDGYAVYARPHTPDAPHTLKDSAA